MSQGGLAMVKKKLGPLKRRLGGKTKRRHQIKKKKKKKKRKKNKTKRPKRGGSDILKTRRERCVSQETVSEKTHFIGVPT